MKHISKCLALFLGLILCLTALVGCSKIEIVPPNDDEGPEQEQQQPETPEIVSNTITCCDGQTTLRFEHDKQGQWQWKDEPDFPLNTAYVDALKATVDKMLALQPITTENTPEDLGLDSDEKYVTVTDDKGHRLTWYLGDTDENGCYYMCRADDESGAIYLAPADLSGQISRSIYDMMLLPQLQVMAAENITGVTIDYGEKTVTTTPNSSGVWVVGISSVNEKAQPMIRALSQLQIASCVDFNPSSGAPAICGLDNPQATVTVDFLNNVGVANTLTFSIGGKLGDGYCVTLAEDTTIYLIKASVVEPILAFIQ